VLLIISVDMAKAAIAYCRDKDSLVYGINNENYPENFRTVPQPPHLIYVKGRLLPLDRIAVAIVGTRKATEEGCCVAYELAKDLASSGVTVVSGLALGIDTCAHKGALSAGGRTIACMASGVDVIYPKENTALAGKIMKNGALVSEYPNGTKPFPWHFPARNRLISGMSLGVVVVEAGISSGALITAKWALEQGRPVMAVPGGVRSKQSAGTNKLLQDGAYLVTDAGDVISFLKQENEYVPDLTTCTSREQVSLEEGAFLARVDSGMLTIQEICDKVQDMPVSQIVSILSSLEIKGVVTRIAGAKYIIGKN
jgi:DNA processing protein